HSMAAEHCAIFLTYDLNRIWYKALDAELWRSTYSKVFWSKLVWIVPIHRPSECHWVLAVVHLQLQEVHLFDSLAWRSSWRRDIPDISVFITRLVELANRNGYSMQTATK
ncbi:hypothetical protein CPB84DRAFT_1657462, partial [Gymnopilus junonius]